MTEPTEPTKAPEAPKAADPEHIKALNDENAKRRLENKELKAQLEQFETMRKELDDLKATKMTEEEKAAADLQALQKQIADSQSEATMLQKQNQLSKYLLEHDIDATHHTLLSAAIESLPLDDAEKMAEQLTPYKKQLQTQLPKVKAPPTGDTNGVNFDDFTNMSEAERQAYLKKTAGKMPFAPDLNKSSW